MTTVIRDHYLCTRSNQTGAKFFRKGFVYSFPRGASVPGGYFTAATDTDMAGPARLLTKDIDNTVRFAPPQWDDFRFPMSAFKQGATTKPDYDYTLMGLAFPQNDATEIAYASNLTPHGMLVEPDVRLYPHLHWIQESAALPVFEYRYRITAANALVPAWSAWIPLDAHEFTWASGQLHQISIFPDFDAYAAGFTNLAALVDLQIRRNDNVVTGDVIVKEFDFHALFDSFGSGQEFIK